MQSLVSYARSTFWTLGLVEILFGLYVLLLRRPEMAPHARASTLMLEFGLVLLALGAVGCAAAHFWRHQKKFTSPLLAINSLFALPLFPFGTAAGLVGLTWWFWS